MLVGKEIPLMIDSEDSPFLTFMLILNILNSLWSIIRN
ncbi:hypothetical protein LEP1GSC103_1290 [Leptospira borgpetersenii serovar Javanica str. UI 09931]|uniref:Uncharacterized protein n=5 Tax=Leptospira borgpetersenii TaxID=174 RepID=M3HN77_LEPBO|nr:hypothetical protein LBBP_02851 [Leptospira borgpetersenii serovar Ballum]EKP15032.1 hypothetical protein LEP1GSC128_2382 [Leptospira borgpetersenii str. 200801926]EKQ90091.1 hypothetical protein LEP1GSC101_2177 [Leptospira borgpetersenii str. UI 09149]EKQ99161.1 hypothetical protein LEP1GSC121_2576 [Leptospira borgpetersenii serovar Castellonis str. 200801910]EMF99089.1 hypothetical protein LEP1GSC123_0175 [Leptospira borgpetersenii str. 200701203]EMK12095.1 hypothetical protein LEP1GSC066